MAVATLALGMVLLVIVAGAVIETWCARRDRGRFGPPGRMVNGLHVRIVAVTGPGPVAILEAGLAGSCASWARVQAELTRRGVAGSCSYDRGGYGWSPVRLGDRSLRALTDDLHALIHALGVPPPFVLVGHSFGALVAGVYVFRFPSDVSGLVLVDPATVEEWAHPSMSARWRLRRAAFFTRVTGLAARMGLVRLGLWALLQRGPGRPGPVLGVSATLQRVADGLAKLPQDVVPALRARWCRPAFYRTMAQEIESMPRYASEAAASPIPPDVPVVVLSGAHQPQGILDLHAVLAGTHLVAKGSRHWIHLDEPELVVDAIAQVASQT